MNVGNILTVDGVNYKVETIIQKTRLDPCFELGEPKPIQIETVPKVVEITAHETSEDSTEIPVLDLYKPFKIRGFDTIFNVREYELRDEIDQQIPEMRIEAITKPKLETE